MEDEAFQELLESARQMVAIEKGLAQPGRVTKYAKETVSQIRRNANKTQGEFARMLSRKPEHAAELGAGDMQTEQVSGSTIKTFRRKSAVR